MGWEKATTGHNSKLYSSIRKWEETGRHVTDQPSAKNAKWEAWLEQAGMQKKHSRLSNVNLEKPVADYTSATILEEDTSSICHRD